MLTQLCYDCHNENFFCNLFYFRTLYDFLFLPLGRYKNEIYLRNFANVICYLSSRSIGGRVSYISQKFAMWQLLISHLRNQNDYKRSPSGGEVSHLLHLNFSASLFILCHFVCKWRVVLRRLLIPNPPMCLVTMVGSGIIIDKWLFVSKLGTIWLAEASTTQMRFFHGDSLKHGSSHVFSGTIEAKICRQMLVGRSMLEDGARHVGLFYPAKLSGGNWSSNSSI
jgi:hypothetical protein